MNSISDAAIGAGLSTVFRAILTIPQEIINKNIANRTRIELPTPEMAMRLWHGGRIGNATANMLCGWHGMDFGAGITPANDFQQVWKLFADAARPIPPLEKFRKWVRQGRVEEMAFIEAASRHGFGNFVMNGCRGQTFGELVRNDIEQLAAGSLQSMLHLGLLDEIQVRERLIALGYSRDDSLTLVGAMRSRPAISDALQMFRRHLIDRDELGKIMLASGYTSGADRENLQQFVDVLPDASSIVATARQQGWDNAVAQRWGLDDETPQQLKSWAKRLGFAYGSSVNQADESRTEGTSWDQQIWRNHWMMPGLAVLAECLHRFRGDPNDRQTWSNPRVPPLTTEQSIDMLRAAGVPPGFRQHAIELLYAPMSIRHIRVVYAQIHVPQVDANGVQLQDANGNPVMGRRPRQWIVDRLMDIGNSPVVANDVARAMELAEVAKEEAPIRKINAQAAAAYLHEIKSAYRVGTLTRENTMLSLTQAGVPNYTADIIVATIDMQSFEAVIKAVIARARSDYFAGRTDKAGAFGRLTGARMDPAKATLTIQSWEAAFGEGRRHIATNKILVYLRKGYLTQEQALARLDNLGWAKADELLMLAEVQGLVEHDMAATEKAANLSNAKQAAALQRLLDRNQRNKDRILAHLKSVGPPSSIMEWVRDGIWTAAQAERRLQILGYPADIIAAMLEEAALKASKSNPTNADRAKKVASNLSRLYPQAKIIKYYIDGVWTVEKARETLAKTGYTQEAIDAMIADADKHKKH